MNKSLLYLIVGALIFRLLISPFAWHSDLNNHIDWGIKIFEYTPSKMYSPDSNVWAYTWPNQPPGTLLIFAIVRLLYEAIFNMFWKLNTTLPAFPSGVVTWIDNYLYPVLLKLPAILSDLAISALIYKIVLQLKNKKSALVASSVFLFNPVIWYNSAIWGQTDSVINALALLSVYSIFKKRLLIGLITFFLCIFVKISLIIFTPFILILLIRRGYSLANLVKTIAVAFLVIILFTLPFSGNNEPIGWLYNIYTQKVLVNQLQLITANAFNLWALISGIKEQPHGIFLGPITYQVWGMLLFILSLIPLAIKLWRKPNLITTLWVLSLVAFSSWLLLTNMHERYLYPLFPYLTIISVLNAKYFLIYTIVSAVNLLNLYHLWYVPRIEFIISLMNTGDGIIPRILGGVSTGLYALYYYSFLKYTKTK